MSGLDKFSFGIPADLRFGCGVMDERQKASLPGKRVMIVTGGQTIRRNALSGASGVLTFLEKMTDALEDQGITYQPANNNKTSYAYYPFSSDVSFTVLNGQIVTPVATVNG